VFRNATKDPRRAMRNTMLMREKLQLLGRIGERISIIRESLLGVDRMVDFAADNAKDWFGPELHDRLRQACQDINALNEFEEHLLGKVQFLLDAVLGFISIEQNDIFKVLTVASVVGIFPTLVAGWYGMNFANMPELHWAYGYQFGIGVIVLSTIAPLLWFKWRGWL
jgi:magnesium transporter